MKDEQLIIHDSNSNAQSFSLTKSNFKLSEPLWKRVPTRDHTGKPYTDFMMLIPGLKSFEPIHLRETIHKLEAVLKRYENDIILADLNLKINILWVTLQPHIGLSSEIVALIHHVVPQAKLVSQHAVSA